MATVESAVFAPNAVKKPKFDLDTEFVLRLNLQMAEDLLDFFDACASAKVSFQPHIWAMYKQFENWVGQPEDEAPTRRKSFPR